MDSTEPQNHKPPFKLSGERIAFLLGGTLIGALAIWFGLKMATPIVKKVCQSVLESPDKADRGSRVVSVEAIVVKPGTISRRITTVGKLRANEFVTLRAEMQGRIKEIAFKEGSMVKKGDVLIRFEDEELQAELARAEADVEYRQVRFGRLESLQSKGLGKGTEYDQERGGLNMAKAQVDVAKAKLAKATIYAPFDGKIGLIDVSVGAIVDSQKELVTIVDFDPMKIDFKIPEKFIHDIGVGQTAEVKLDSIPNQTFQATVEAIDSRVDPQTHSIAVRAIIPNEDGKLQTGLFGSVGVIIGVKNDALLVPESALGREGDIEFVWVVVNGKTGRKRVLTGTKENGQAEITAGLRPDEIVVTSGQLKLGEGSAVKISNMGDEDIEVPDEEDTVDSKESSTPNQAKAGSTKDAEGKSEESPKKDDKGSDASPPKSQEPEVKLQNTPQEDTNVKANAPQESVPTTLPDSQKDEAPSKEQAPAETKSLEKPSDTDKTNEEPHKIEPKISEENTEDGPATKSEKSFFGKTRDFIVNKFKGS